jgi:hypothetical protein
MKLTLTKIEFMHGECSNTGCPICKGGTYQDADTWLRKILTVEASGLPKSPWWDVVESNGDCYRALRGDLRLPGYYDKNPEIH